MLSDMNPAMKVEIKLEVAETAFMAMETCGPISKLILNKRIVFDSLALKAELKLESWGNASCTRRNRKDNLEIKFYIVLVSTGFRPFGSRSGSERTL